MTSMGSDFKRGSPGPLILVRLRKSPDRAGKSLIASRPASVIGRPSMLRIAQLAKSLQMNQAGVANGAHRSRDLHPKSEVVVAERELCELR